MSDEQKERVPQWQQTAGRPEGPVGQSRIRGTAHSGGSDTMRSSMGLMLHWLHDVAAVTLLKAQRTLFQAAVLLCVLVLLLWVSIFLYGSFYYSYMPTVSFSTPVHFYYTADCDSSESTLCSFPTANISFMKNERTQVMAHSQPYRISLEMEMPESAVNEQLGMFMVKMSAYTKGGETVSSVGRSTMLHYRSSLLQTISTLVFSPLLLAGMAEQKQLIEVELFSDYKANSYKPTIGAVIQIQSKRVQVYSAQLRIHAYFTGIRYILFNFPLTSAMIGVAANFAFLIVIVLFSYLQFIWGGLWPPDQVRVKVMMGDNTRITQRKEEARKRMERENSKKEVGSPQVIGPVMESPTCQESHAAPGSSPKEPPGVREASEPGVVGNTEGGSQESVSPEETNGTIEPDECQLPQQGETALRQRPGPWMSL